MKETLIIELFYWLEILMVLSPFILISVLISVGDRISKWTNRH